MPPSDGNSLPTEIDDGTRLLKWDTDSVLKGLEARFNGGSFPLPMLNNRLLNMGLREFMDGDARAQDRTSAVETHGFPFKFYTQLDEAILALAYFLERFRSKEGERGRLRVLAINRPVKGQDRDLTFWQSAKSKIYIELQNLVLLQNGRDDRKTEVARIFAFREMDELAYLTRAGIGALSEMRGLANEGVQVGFLFLNCFKEYDFSNTLIIDYEPECRQPDDNNHFFYRLIDNTTSEHLPYEGRCSAMWFRDREAALFGESIFEESPSSTQEPFRNRPLSSGPPLSKLLELSDHAKWKDELRETNSVCKFPKKGTAFFNCASIMMYEAAKKKNTDLLERITKSAIPWDQIELEKAMLRFRSSNEIHAVDATSLKGGLDIHLANPVYRHWIRESLNRVVLSARKSRGSFRSLTRIYILDDDAANSADEFRAIGDILKYYFDYFHFELSEISWLLKIHKGDGMHEILDTGSLEEFWKAMSRRISIWVTTRGILREKGHLFQKPEFLDSFVSDDPDPLARVDFLLTDDMIYNFKNDKGDPLLAVFEAGLIRQNLTLGTEQKSLFRATDGHPDLEELGRQIVKSRSEALRDSIEKYIEHHEATLTSPAFRLEKHPQLEVFLESRDLTGQTPVNLVEIRASIESILYERFRSDFDYVYGFIEANSAKVQFFADDKVAQSIDHVAPLAGCANMAGLAENIKEELERNPIRLPAAPKSPGSLSDVNMKGTR